MGCCCGHKKVVKNDFNKLEPKKPVQVEIDNTAELQRLEAERLEKLRLQKLKEEEEERKRKEEEARRKEEEARRKKEQEEREAKERELERLRKLKEEEEIRVANLLLTKPIEVNKSLEPPEEEIDEKKFTDLMNNIRELVPNYEKFQKDSFSTICTKSINDTSSSGTFVSNRFGPQIKNKRICDIKEGEKYDFSKMIKDKQFIEYKDNDLILERLLEKPKHSVCSYLGKIQGKYCCVKLIPCVKLQEAKRWITAVDTYQKQIINPRFQANFKLYSYYKLEDVEQTNVNIYIMSNLEQYNAYTIATDEKITIEQKAKVMYESIGILKTVIISKYSNKENEQQKQQGKPEQVASNKLFEQVQKNIYTVKNNNILISLSQQVSVYLADWQLLVEEFQNIIPYTQIQTQDQQMQHTLLGTSNNLIQHQQSESMTNQAKDQVEKFIKECLKLMSFGVNYQLNSEVKLKCFISNDDFEKYSINFLDIANEESDIFKSIVQKIKNSENMNYTDQERKLLIKKSQLIQDKLNLHYQINEKPFLLFLIIQKIDFCETMRPLLEKQIYSDLSESKQNGQNNQIQSNIIQAR